MALSYTTTLRSAQLEEINTAVGNAGLLRFYSGSVPANVGASLGAATLLAELTCGTPFGTVSGPTLTAGSITQDSSANATGTASFFRLATSGGTAIIQGTVTATGGGGDITLTTTSITSGQPVQVTSFVITDGNA